MAWRLPSGAAQASESVIFSIEGTPKQRRDNEPRWRLASCFSGLLHDVGKPLADVSITDKNGVVTWNPYFESLHDWAGRNHVDRYFIRWRRSAISATNSSLFGSRSDHPGRNQGISLGVWPADH